MSAVSMPIRKGEKDGLWKKYDTRPHHVFGVVLSTLMPGDPDQETGECDLCPCAQDETEGHPCANP